MRDTKRLSGDSDTRIVEGIHRDRETLPGTIQHILDRHFAVFEEQRTGVGRANTQFVFLLADAESFHARIDDERRRPAVPLDAVIGVVYILREEHVNLRALSIRDPHLLAVEHIMRAVFADFRAAAEGCRVGAGTCFRERIGADLTRCKSCQIALFLVFVTV